MSIHENDSYRDNDNALQKLCEIYPGPYSLLSLHELSCCDCSYLCDTWRKPMPLTPEDAYMINLAEYNVTAYVPLHCPSLKCL